MQLHLEFHPSDVLLSLVVIAIGIYDVPVELGKQRVLDHKGFVLLKLEVVENYILCLEI